jgi:hypothetical protein
MEPLNDKELDAFLSEWQAPPAPPSLEERFFPRAQPVPWWRWLAGGTIRIPVPIATAIVAILMTAVFFGVWNRRPTGPPRREVGFSDFRPVNQLKPRIIRRSHESN